MGWVGIPGSGSITIDGDVSVISANNIKLNGGNVASGQGVLAIANATTLPFSLSNLGGGVAFVQSGQLKFMTSDGSHYWLTGPNAPWALSLNPTLTGDARVASASNLLINGNANVMSGQGILALGNAITEPSSLGSVNGGVLYVHSGTLMYRGALGTVTSLARL